MKLSELPNQVLEGMLKGQADAGTMDMIRNELRARGVAVEGPPRQAKRPGGGSRFAGLNVGAVRTRGRMNKTEARYAEHLETQKLASEIRDYAFERIKLRISDPLPGERAVWFTGDFIIIDNDGLHYLDDVKGSGPDNDASIVRAKLCPVAWPHWTYRIVRRTRGGWEYRQL